MKQMDKIIAFDLDDVICTRPKGCEHLGGGKYYKCKPVPKMVKIVNETYEAGYIVKIYTARGMSVFNGDVTKIYSNLYDLTSKQLSEWGVKYHQLVMGKLHYDLLIDDKTVFSENIASLEDIKTIVND